MVHREGLCVVEDEGVAGGRVRGPDRQRAPLRQCHKLPARARLQSIFAFLMIMIISTLYTRAEDPIHPLVYHVIRQYIIKL